MRRSTILSSLLSFGGTLAAPPPQSDTALARFLTDTDINVTNNLPLISIPPSAPRVAIAAPSNNTLRSDDEKTYVLLGTDLTLRVRWWTDRPIDHDGLGAYLQDIQMEVMQHIARYRDGPLMLFGEDPYRRRGAGFYAIFSSTTSPSHPEQHLTYRFLYQTLEGLYDVLFVGNHADASYTTITHEKFGVLGTAVVSPSDPVPYGVATA